MGSCFASFISNRLGRIHSPLTIERLSKCCVRCPMSLKFTRQEVLPIWETLQCHDVERVQTVTAGDHHVESNRQQTLDTLSFSTTTRNTAGCPQVDVCSAKFIINLDIWVELYRNTGTKISRNASHCGVKNNRSVRAQCLVLFRGIWKV